MTEAAIKFIPVEAVKRLLALREGKKPISWRALGVGIVLTTFMNEEGKCRVRRETIAKRARVHIGDVSRSTQELVRRGFISKRRTGGASEFKIEKWQNAHIRSSRLASSDVADPLHISNTLKKEKKPSPSGSGSNGAATTKKTKKPSEESSSRPNGGDVWAWWHDANIAAGRRKPVSAGADTKAAKSLADRIQVEELTEAELKACMVLYLEDPDRWLASHGHALRHLPGRINSYLNRIEEQARQDAANSQAALAIEEALEPIGAQQ